MKLANFNPVRLWQRAATLYATMTSNRWIVCSAVLLFVFGLYVICFHQNDIAVVRLVLWACAFSMSGMVIGFLFGIPRGDARTVNNNLVEISDWLTKIIVGVGLTELHALPGYIGRLTRFMVGTGVSPTFSQSAAGATFLFFTSHGFFLGYLLTRLVLNVLFAETTRKLGAILGVDLQKALVEGSVRTEMAQADELKAQSDPQLRAIVAVPIDQITDPRELAVWAKANLMLGNYTAALNAYLRAALQLPDDARIAAEIAMAMFKAGQPPDTAFVQLLRARDLLDAEPDAGLRRDIFKWLTYVSLYRAKPASYLDALRFAHEYLSVPNAEASAGFFINKACAHGQEFAAEKDKAVPSRPLGLIEADVLLSLRRALIIHPGYREHIAGLLHGDDDLLPFKGKDSFERLVALGFEAADSESL